jgi:spore coat protein U-like protein
LSRRARPQRLPCDKQPVLFDDRDYLQTQVLLLVQDVSYICFHRQPVFVPSTFFIRQLESKMQKLSLLAAAALATVVASASAASNPATAQFQVLIKVQKACSVIAGASSNIDFSTVDSSATNLSSSSSITVTCSKTTPYTVGLLPSNNNTSGAGAMVATPSNGDSVPYQLRSVSAAGSNWGSTSGTVPGTGNGLAQTIPVFATIPGTGANVTPASYSDTVTVSVTY